MTVVGSFLTTSPIIGTSTTGNRWQSWFSLSYTAVINSDQQITLYVYKGSTTNANIDEDSTEYSIASYILENGTNILYFLETVVEKEPSIKLKFMMTTTSITSPLLSAITLKELYENWYVTTSYPSSGKHAPKIVFQNMIGKEEWNGLNRGDDAEVFLPLVLTVEFLYPLNFDETIDADWSNKAKDAVFTILDTFFDNMEGVYFQTETYGFEPLYKAQESENVILDTYTYAYTIDFETVYHRG